MEFIDRCYFFGVWGGVGSISGWRIISFWGKGVVLGLIIFGGK